MDHTSDDEFNEFEEFIGVNNSDIIICPVSISIASFESIFGRNKTYMILKNKL